MYWDWSAVTEPQLCELRERTEAASLDDTPQELFRIAQVIIICTCNVYCILYIMVNALKN